MIGFKWVSGIDVINGNLKVDFYYSKQIFKKDPAGISLFKCTGRGTRAQYELCLKLTKTTPE